MARGKNLKFNKNLVDNKNLTTGGRKEDSNYYRRKIRNKKVAYISHLIKNVSQVVIVAAITFPKIKPGLIDRFLILASKENKEIVILLTKTDLEVPELEYSSKELIDTYNKIGYKALAISNENDKKIPELVKLFKDKNSALVGHSGVGKTSLLNNIDPNFKQEVKEISSFTKRGRHTTTQIRLTEFSFKGTVYDMPGLKELDFIDIHKKELSVYYPEFTEHLDQCKFSDCLHLQEEVCGIKEAVNKKLISKMRYENYLSILGDLLNN